MDEVADARRRMPDAGKGELLMSKGFLTIFRKPEVAKASPGSYALPPPAKPVREPPPLPPLPELPRARLVLAFDATASRSAAWATSTALTTSLLTALPGELDVALAVHGGGKLHTFTRFERNADKLRDHVAGVRCISGTTRLLDILARVLATDGVTTVVYVGDVFEESEKQARKLAVALAARNIRLIVLQDADCIGNREEGIFAEMTALTGGALLPFEARALPKLRDLFEAVAVLAVGDVTMLTAKQETMPAARLLLEHLKGSKP
jgi:hypothetical protein